MTENRLAQASSAYLRSAAHQPIDWHEFNEEAFAKAQKLDRPILLDIGAVWCHWCHVIDRESYEDDAIASLINEHYVAVKVDRDQRPDVDSRYQQVVASMTGRGGWPLTAILTPDGRVLFGGTYFPPEVMTKILVQMKDMYHAKKEDFMKDALSEKPLQSEPAPIKLVPDGEAVTISEEVFESVVAMAKQTFDAHYGGFGGAQKFPHYSGLAYLMKLANATGRDDLDDIIQKSLDAMALGGIRDHIGGGIHRYAVDQYWHVPHFEKMAYDNAEALSVYAQAYRLFGNPLYLDMAKSIVRFLMEELSSQTEGGFYASQDADIDLEDDGDYFTWTLAEVEAILTQDEYNVVIAHFGMTHAGNMHGRAGRNVLRYVRSLPDIAEALEQPLETIEGWLASATQKMKAQRDTRPKPFVDESVYLNWNGMLVGALFEAADLLNQPEWQMFAQKTLDQLMVTHVNKNVPYVYHSAGVPGFFEDYAWFIDALRKGYQSTGKQIYLDEALYWTQVACDLFEDPREGGFYDIVPPTETALALLRFRRKVFEDTPSSSANGVMLRNLVALHHLTEEESYLQKVQQAARTKTERFESGGLYMAAAAIAFYELKYAPLMLDVVGASSELGNAARQLCVPGKLIRYTPSETASEIRVCEGQRCLQPVTDVAELQSMLETLSIKPSVC